MAMTVEEEQEYKRYFQRLKSTSFQSFPVQMNIMHTRAYAAAHMDAMLICLQLKQREEVKAKVIEMERMATVMPDKTKKETLEG